MFTFIQTHSKLSDTDKLKENIRILLSFINNLKIRNQKFLNIRHGRILQRNSYQKFWSHKMNKKGYRFFLLKKVIAVLMLIF